MYFLDAEQERLVDEYTGVLRTRIADVVGQCAGGPEAGDADLEHRHIRFAVNRRTNKEPEVPKLIEEGKLKGPVDHDVPVLAVRGATTASCVRWRSATRAMPR